MASPDGASNYLARLVVVPYLFRREPLSLNKKIHGVAHPPEARQCPRRLDRMSTPPLDR